MEVLNLNRIPVGSNPVVHVSQYDVGRVFRFNLFDGSNTYTLDGTETIECNVRKLDGNVVTVSVTNTSSNYVDIVTTEQMTAIHGQNYGEVVFKKGGNIIGSINFILAVEQSPLEGGITSDSAIYNLQVQVANYVASEVATQYDSANVIFDNAPTSGHGSPYTVTSEGIKTAIDNAFDFENTASGSIIHITDGGDDIPVKSLVSQIVAVESGNGQPKSPSNPYTISGFNSGVVSVCGANIFDISTITANSRIDGINGSVASSTASFVSDYIPVVSGSIRVIFDYSSLSSTSVRTWGFYDGNKTFLGYVQFDITVKSQIFVIPNGTSYLRCTFDNGNTDILLSYNLTATTYEAYNGTTYTFTFGQTVYGGHFDNKGNLVVTHGLVQIKNVINNRTTSYTNPVFYGNLTGRKTGSDIQLLCECLNYVGVFDGASTFSSSDDNSIGATSGSVQILIRADSYSDVASLKNAIGDNYICYELETPTTLTITGQDIPTALGENNIFSNCGNVEVDYFTEKANAIAELIKAFM